MQENSFFEFVDAIADHLANADPSRVFVWIDAFAVNQHVPAEDLEQIAAAVALASEGTLLVLDKQTLAEGLGIDGWTGALVRALAHRFRDLEKQVRASGIRRE